MGLVVEGLDMPKSCKDCKLLQDTFDWFNCEVGAKDGKPLDLENSCDEFVYNESRHPDCPLRKLSASSEDLVDRNYLLEKLSVIPKEIMPSTARIIKRLIETAPSAIKTEE